MIFRRNDDEGFEKKSIFGLLTAPFRFLLSKYEELTYDESAAFRDELSGGQRVVAFLTFPLRLVWAFAFFMVMAWTTSRNGFAFIRGAPAIAIAVVFCLSLWVTEAFLDRGAHAIARYQYHVRYTPDKPEYALMFAEKMIELRPQETALFYQLGVSQERIGKESEAFSIMKDLASRDTEGRSSANVWLARHYVRQATIELDDRKYDKQVLDHLSAAYDADNSNIFALVGLADFYQREGDLQSAVKYLGELVSTEITNEVQIVQYPRFIRLKNELNVTDSNASADLDFTRAINRIMPIARRHPERFQIWYSMVQCAVLMKNYKEANQIIGEGFQTAKDPAVRQKIARLSSAIMITNADDFPNLDDQKQYKLRLYALCDAIRRNPRNREAYTRLIDYAIIPEEKSERAYWLRDAILGCSNPAVIHILIGIHEISNGNFVLAQEQWEIAKHEFESAEFVVNNMIEIATTDRPNELENLMDMVTVAIEMFNNEPVLYQTRARFLISQERYEEAVNDLNFTIKHMPRLVTAYKMLVECHEKLGNLATAAELRQKLDQILRDLDDEQRRMVEKVLSR